MISVPNLVFLVSLLAELMLGAALLSRPAVVNSTRLLFLLLGSIAVITLQELLIKNGAGVWIWSTYWLVMALWFSTAPLIYLFVRSLVDLRFQFRKSMLWLFIIPFYVVVEWVINFIGIHFQVRGIMDFNWFLFLWIGLFLSQSLFFTIKAILAVRQSDLPKLQQQKTRWLRTFLYVLLGVHTLSLLVFFYQFFIGTYSDIFETFQMSFYGFFVLGIVFNMLRSSPYFDQEYRAQYANSPLNEAGLTRLENAVDQLMHREKLFLHKSLSLAELAVRAQVPEYQLSQLFSQHLDSNFYDFVNEYRLKEFEKTFKEGSMSHLTIFAVAEHCGFNSRANFYKVFKKKHGVAPSVYLKR